MASSEDRIRGLVGDLAYKAPVRMASTGNLVLYGLQTVDSVVGVDGDRVAVKNNTAGVENGFYNMGAGNWVRTADFDGARDVVQYTRVDVIAGIVNGGKTFRLTTPNPVIGVSGLTFAEVPAGAEGISLYDEGVLLGTPATSINFTGGGVAASQIGAVATVNVPGGGGGNPFAGYSWVSYTGVRLANVLYTNTTGRAIQVSVASGVIDSYTGPYSARIQIDAITDHRNFDGYITADFVLSRSYTTSAWVPAGSTYQFIDTFANVNTWLEFR